MSANASKSSATIGFLTVCEHEGQGLFGGYLLLNTAGRPLEFYCTAPVRTNRAQEILYGQTLKPYLYGEQIGPALLEKARAKPLLVFTDVEPVLAVRDFAACPVAYVVGPAPGPDGSVASGGATAAPDASARPFSLRLHTFAVGEQRLAVRLSHVTDATDIAQLWQPYAADFDVCEPFQRIRDAIDEARRSARSAA